MSSASSTATTSIYAPGGSNQFGASNWVLIVGLLVVGWVLWKLFKK